MYREIKYRVWDKIDKKMLTVRALLFDKLNNNKLITILADSEDNKFTKAFTNEKYSYEHKDIITVPFENCSRLMQFTGLIDENGVEIYDGDIIDMGYGKFEVKIGEFYAYLSSLGKYYIMGVYFKDEDGVDVPLENNKGLIVGNIFEDKEENE